jgi:hypothetical protein
MNQQHLIEARGREIKILDFSGMEDLAEYGKLQ